jgi:hypothetical protein
MSPIRAQTNLVSPRASSAILYSAPLQMLKVYYLKYKSGRCKDYEHLWWNWLELFDINVGFVGSKSVEVNNCSIISVPSIRKSWR